MKSKVLNCGKILLSIIMLPLWFVDMFKGVGHLPDQDTGEIIEVVFRHSMFDNMSSPVFAYLSIAMIIASVVLNVMVLKYPKMRIAGNAVFGFAIGTFVILLLFASSVGRGY